MTQGGGRVVLWDFEGTLAYRPGQWSQCLVEVLDGQGVAHGLRHEDFSAALRRGFPWHDWQRPHPQLCDPQVWWAALQPVFTGAFMTAGLPEADARRLAAKVRDRYLDPAAWRVAADAAAALGTLTAAGWRHAVLSNHVPELPRLIDQLGLGDLVDVVFTSAETGVEKPHPEAFGNAVRALGDPGRVWMVGDSLEADIRGATRAGIPAIMVGGQDPGDGVRWAADLTAASRRILAG